VPANRFGTTITRQQLDANTLQIDEDITFNNARVGGVRVQFDFLQPDAQKLAGFTIVANVGDQTHLDQQVDLTYAGQPFQRLHVSAVPAGPEETDPKVKFWISIETTATAGAVQPPVTVSTATLP
jgi:hypothetical protein